MAGLAVFTQNRLTTRSGNGPDTGTGGPCTVTGTSPAQLFAVSDSSATACTHAP